MNYLHLVVDNTAQVNEDGPLTLAHYIEAYGIVALAYSLTKLGIRYIDLTMCTDIDFVFAAVTVQGDDEAIEFAWEAGRVWDGRYLNVDIIADSIFAVC